MAIKQTVVGDSRVSAGRSGSNGSATSLAGASGDAPVPGSAVPGRAVPGNPVPGNPSGRGGRLWWRQVVRAVRPAAASRAENCTLDFSCLD